MRLMKWNGRAYVETDDAGQVELHIANLRSQAWESHLVHWGQFFAAHIKLLPEACQAMIMRAYEDRRALIRACDGVAVTKEIAVAA